MNLKEQRKKLGLSQIDVAFACGVHINTYVLWERGVAKPSDINKKKLYEVLKMKEGK